jgi:hypothetical protein
MFRDRYRALHGLTHFIVTVGTEAGRKDTAVKQNTDSPQLLSDLFANNERNSSQCFIMPHLKSKYNAATKTHRREMICAP